MWNWVGKVFNKIKSILLRTNKEIFEKVGSKYSYKRKTPEEKEIAKQQRKKQKKSKSWDPNKTEKEEAKAKTKEVKERRAKVSEQEWQERSEKRAKDLIIKTTGMLNSRLTDDLNNIFEVIKKEQGENADTVFWNMYQAIKHSGFNFYTSLLSSQNTGLLDYQALSGAFYEEVVNAYNKYKGGLDELQ